MNRDPRQQTIILMRGWLRMRGISMMELAFRALILYRTLNEGKAWEHNATMYSFIGILCLRTQRYELLEYLEEARQEMVNIHSVPRPMTAKEMVVGDE